MLDGLVCHELKEGSYKKEDLAKCINSVIQSKQYGCEEKLTSMVTDACWFAMPVDPKKFNVDNVRVQKILGGSLRDSEVVHGMVVLRSSETSIHEVEKAKVAVFNTPLEMNQGETKGTILLHNAEELLSYTKGEEEAMEKFVVGLAEAGVNVVVASGSISEVALHFLEKYKMMTLRIMSKFEIKRIAKSVGATCLVKLGKPTPDELGFAETVKVQEISSQRCVVIRRNDDENRYATVVIRGSTNQYLDDIERAIDDGVNTVKSLVKDGRLLPGAGATEIHLAHKIHEFAKQQPGLDQYAVEKFGHAFEVIPRTLAENAGHKAEEIIAKLYAETIKNSKAGISIEDGTVKDAVEMGVLDSIETKSWAIKLSIDAVLTILRVDQIIMSKPAGGPKPREAPAPDMD